MDDDGGADGESKGALLRVDELSESTYLSWLLVSSPSSRPRAFEARWKDTHGSGAGLAAARAPPTKRGAIDNTSNADGQSNNDPNDDTT